MKFFFIFSTIIHFSCGIVGLNKYLNNVSLDNTGCSSDDEQYSNYINESDYGNEDSGGYEIASEYTEYSYFYDDYDDDRTTRCYSSSDKEDDEFDEEDYDSKSENEKIKVLIKEINNLCSRLDDYINRETALKTEIADLYKRFESERHNAAKSSIEAEIKTKKEDLKTNQQTYWDLQSSIENVNVRVEKILTNNKKYNSEQNDTRDTSIKYQESLKNNNDNEALYQSSNEESLGYNEESLDAYDISNMFSYSNYNKYDF